VVLFGHHQGRLLFDLFSAALCFAVVLPLAAAAPVKLQCLQSQDAFLRELALGNSLLDAFVETALLFEPVPERWVLGVVQRDAAMTVFLVVGFQLNAVLVPRHFLRAPRKVDVIEELDALFRDGVGFSNLIEFVLFALFRDLLLTRS